MERTELDAISTKEAQIKARLGNELKTEEKGNLIALDELASTAVEVSQVRASLAHVTRQQTALKSVDGINESLLHIIGRFLEYYKLSNYIHSTFDLGRTSNPEQFVAEELQADYDVTRINFPNDDSRNLKRMLTKTKVISSSQNLELLVRENVSNSIPSLRNIPLEVNSPQPLSPRNQKAARMNHLRTILKQVLFDVPNLLSNLDIYAKSVLLARNSLDSTQKHFLRLLVRHRNTQLEYFVRILCNPKRLSNLLREYKAISNFDWHLEEEFKRVDCPWNKIDSKASEAQVNAFTAWNSQLLEYYHLIKGILYKTYKLSERIIKIAPSVTYPENLLSTIADAHSFEEQDSRHISTNSTSILLEMQANVKLNSEAESILYKNGCENHWDAYLLHRLLEWYLSQSKVCRLVYNRWEQSDLVSKAATRLRSHPIDQVIHRLVEDTNQRYLFKMKENITILTKLFCTLQMEIVRGKGHLLDDYRLLLTKIFASLGDESFSANHLYVSKNPIIENISLARSISRTSAVAGSGKEELSRERLSTKAEFDPDISLTIAKGVSSSHRPTASVSAL